MNSAIGAYTSFVMLRHHTLNWRLLILSWCHTRKRLGSPRYYAVANIKIMSCCNLELLGAYFAIKCHTSVPNTQNIVSWMLDYKTWHSIQDRSHDVKRSQNYPPAAYGPQSCIVYLSNAQDATVPTNNSRGFRSNSLPIANISKAQQYLHKWVFDDMLDIDTRVNVEEIPT